MPQWFATSRISRRSNALWKKHSLAIPSSQRRERMHRLMSDTTNKSFKKTPDYSMDVWKTMCYGKEVSHRKIAESAYPVNAIQQAYSLPKSMSSNVLVHDRFLRSWTPSQRIPISSINNRDSRQQNKQHDYRKSLSGHSSRQPPRQIR